MSVRLRPAVVALPSYVAGHNVAGAIKLSRNESAYGPLPYVVERIATTAAGANRYPDIVCEEVGEAIAARHGVNADQVVVGCGSGSLCQ
jgi:histidinol-phosphate aminotransferase